METYYYDGQSQSPLLTRLTAGDVTVETYYYDCQSLRRLLARVAGRSTRVLDRLQRPRRASTPGRFPSRARIVSFCSC